MNIYKWTEDLRTDHAKIDLDHKRIIDKASELSEMMTSGKGRDGIVQTVTFLNDYVAKHFAEEEALQRNNRYPDYEIHKAKHAYFIKELSALTDHILIHQTSAINDIKLEKLISGWFFSHIKESDVEMSRFLVNSEN